VYDLKALLRGVDRGVPREELFDVMIPAGEFDRAALRQLSGARDVNDLMRILSTWGSPYAAPLKRGFKSYERNRSTIEMELALDSFVAGHFLSAVSEGTEDGRIIRTMISTRVDTANVMTLIKVGGEGFTGPTLAELFIEGGGGGVGGGRLSKSDFLKLAETENRETLLTALAGAVSGRDFSDVLLEADSEEPSLLEERFEELVCMELFRAALSDPLSIALPAVFIYMKVREVKNLGTITRGKVFDIPEDELRRILIYPWQSAPA
ncbi:MAG: V-type ATPase subunit, partial [Thermodesulfobacteriota bacterium]